MMKETQFLFLSDETKQEIAQALRAMQLHNGDSEPEILTKEAQEYAVAVDPRAVLDELADVLFCVLRESARHGWGIDMLMRHVANKVLNQCFVADRMKISYARAKEIIEREGRK